MLPMVIDILSLRQRESLSIQQVHKQGAQVTLQDR